MRYKRPDKKNALSILESAERDMKFTLSLIVSDSSSSTIIRNIYECFRMLGDALLVMKGIESGDHIQPIKELLKVDVKMNRPLQLINNLRILRHNLNYYGYKPSLLEVEDTVSFAKACFYPLLNRIKDIT